MTSGTGKRVVVTGATGVIGSAVASALLGRGDTVVALSRDTERARERFGAGVEVQAWPDPGHDRPPRDALAGAHAVVHLLGEPVDQRWTAEAKRAIRESRVESTRTLVAALRALPDAETPAVLVSQSATGYYGASDGGPLDEHAAPGSGFLADVVEEWERAALGAASFMRVVVTRTGVVLSSRGGALGRMLPFFRAGVGGPVAGGGQYVPWVHLDDVVGALLRCIDDPEAHGPVNVTAPHAVTNRELSQTLGRVLRRPAALPVPAFVLRALYGEMASIVVTGQHVVPRRLQELGHAFRQPQLEPALRDVLAAV
jgi:uncharacterized protein (TIGR01777 family)